MITQITAQFQKEHLEALRRKRVLLLVLLFVAAGMMSPLFAKLTPEIMKTALPEGTSITLAAPTSLDSWTQFFKNVSQFGLLALVLLYGDTLAGEVERGTLLPLLPLGLKRQSVVLGKASYLMLTWTLGYWLSFGICYGYTRYFFTDSLSQHIAAGVWPLWLYGLLLCALLLLTSALAQNGLQSLLFFALCFGASLLLGLFKRIDAYNPFTLGSNNLAWLTGTAALKESLPALVGASCLIFVFLWLAQVSFARRLV